jgi:hypothetical protein
MTTYDTDQDLVIGYRVQVGYLLLPKALPDRRGKTRIRRWLEFAKWEEMKEYNISTEQYHWVPKKWLDR